MPMLNNEAEGVGEEGKGTAPRENMCQGHSQVTRGKCFVLKKKPQSGKVKCLTEGWLSPKDGGWGDVDPGPQDPVLWWQ